MSTKKGEAGVEEIYMSVLGYLSGDARAAMLRYVQCLDDRVDREVLDFGRELSTDVDKAIKCKQEDLDDMLGDVREAVRSSIEIKGQLLGLRCQSFRIVDTASELYLAGRAISRVLDDVEILARQVTEVAIRGVRVDLGETHRNLERSFEDYRRSMSEVGAEVDDSVVGCELRKIKGWVEDLRTVSDAGERDWDEEAATDNETDRVGDAAGGTDVAREGELAAETGIEGPAAIELIKKLADSIGGLPKLLHEEQSKRARTLRVEGDLLLQKTTKVMSDTALMAVTKGVDSMDRVAKEGAKAFKTAVDGCLSEAKLNFVRGNSS